MDHVAGPLHILLVEKRGDFGLIYYVLNSINLRELLDGVCLFRNLSWNLVWNMSCNLSCQENIKKKVSHNLDQAHFLEVGLTKIPGDHDTLYIVRHVGFYVDFSSMKSYLGLRAFTFGIYQILFDYIMCEDPHESKFIEIAFGWGPNHIWLHTTLEDPWPHTWFWRHLGTALHTFFWTLKISRSRPLAHVWSVPYITPPLSRISTWNYTYFIPVPDCPFPIIPTMTWQFVLQLAWWHGTWEVVRRLKGQSLWPSMPPTNDTKRALSRVPPMWRSW